MNGNSVQELLQRANAAPRDETSIIDAEREFATEEECAAKFRELAERLRDIRAWKENSTPSSYELFDASGDVVSGRQMAKGDFIRIHVYASGKYDWVRVMDILDRPDDLVITVKPTYDPTEEEPKSYSVSHFFGAEATNNFCLKRYGRTLKMFVIGLDERTNTEFTDGVIETVRNVAAANIGSYLGLQTAMWKEFCENFLGTDQKEQA